MCVCVYVCVLMYVSVSACVRVCAYDAAGMKAASSFLRT